MCSVYDVRGIERHYIDCSKFMRHVWKLPFGTHNSLLPHISNTVQPDIMLHKWIINFVSSGFYSKDKVVNVICNLCLRGNS